VRAGLLATAAGVLASFLAIAAVLSGLKLAGAAVGWGIQFQQPWFLAAMAAAMTLFAASLWGLLPIPLPGFAAGAVSVRSRHATLDAFLAGAFATVMATSCSAPFVGTAVGFALARGPGEIVLVFAALGLGMAAPLLAVAAAPGLVRLLPRPGPWMVVLQRVLGVALAGTAAWLLWVVAQVSGVVAATVTGAALAAMVGALALRGGTGGRGRRAGVAGALAVIAVLVPSLVPPPAVPASSAGQAAQWRPFDQDAIRREVAAGRLVFVDVTAAWCLTCKLNEAAVLDRAPVLDRLRSPGVVAMRADWTRPQPRVTAYLQSFGRYGVPLDVVYGPGRPEGVPLPELLSASAVLDALSKAGARASGQAPRKLTAR
jgi:suppressor for copper-sensitivity B